MRQYEDFLGDWDRCRLLVETMLRPVFEYEAGQVAAPVFDSRVRQVHLLLRQQAWAYVRDVKDADLAGYLRVAAPERYWREFGCAAMTALSDQALAEALDHPSVVVVAAAREEARRRFRPAADELARRVCSAVEHRGAPCAGGRLADCGRARSEVADALLVWIVGRAELPGASGRKALLQWWGREVPFLAYLGKVSWRVEGARAWRAARGLLVHLTVAKLPAGMRREAPVRYARLLASDEEVCRSAESLQLAFPEAVLRIAVALYEDATEAFDGPGCDVARVLRRLGGKPDDPTAVQHAGLLFHRAEQLLAGGWDEWWAASVDRARGTRSRGTVALSVAADTSRSQVGRVEDILDERLLAQASDRFRAGLPLDEVVRWLADVFGFSAREPWADDWEARLVTLLERYGSDAAGPATGTAA